MSVALLPLPIAEVTAISAIVAASSTVTIPVTVSAVGRSPLWIRHAIRSIRMAPFAVGPDAAAPFLGDVDVVGARTAADPTVVVTIAAL